MTIEKRKDTIYDIATAAGVSIATVSKVINNKGRVGEKTRELVKRIMQEKGYSPNRVASALGGKRLHTIAMLIPDISNPYYAELVRGAEDYARNHGYNLFVCNTDNQLERERQYIMMLQQKQVDGIIFSTEVSISHHLSDFTLTDIPFAYITSVDVKGLNETRVLIDNFKGAYAATEYLIQLGHSQIALFTEPLHIPSIVERVKGYSKALMDYQIDQHPSWIRECGFGIESSRQIVREMIKENVLPTAVFAVNDLLAIGVVQELKAQGITVPKQVSVVGFDNTIFSTIIDPPLTTVSQPIYDIGSKVTEMLICSIQGNSKNKDGHIFIPELVIRYSAAAPRKD